MTVKLWLVKTYVSAFMLLWLPGGKVPGIQSSPIPGKLAAGCVTSILRGFVLVANGLLAIDEFPIQNRTDTKVASRGTIRNRTLGSIQTHAAKCLGRSEAVLVTHKAEKMTLGKLD